MTLDSRCQEEDFVKSFLPSLFDSDSESEDTFASVKCDTLKDFSEKQLHVHLGKPMRKTTSSEAFSKAQSYNKRALTHTEQTIKEEIVEASSPSSQENSNTSSRTPFSSVLESENSLDCSSPFYSVLSFESTDTVFDFEPSSFSEDHTSASKRQKIAAGPVAMRGSPMSASCTTSSISQGLRADSSPSTTILSAQSVPSPLRLMPQTPNLIPRHSLPAHSPVSYVGGITTGIPVDSHPSEVGRAWAAPQVMIPTTSSNTFYASQFHSHIPSNLPAPVTSLEKIAASLQEVKKAPLGAPPLGLKLDKSSFAASLQSIGMVLKD